MEDGDSVEWRTNGDGVENGGDVENGGAVE